MELMAQRVHTSEFWQTFPNHPVDYRGYIFVCDAEGCQESVNLNMKEEGEKELSKIVNKFKKDGVGKTLIMGGAQ